MPHLKITYPNSLLSVAVDREVSERVVARIALLLDEEEKRTQALDQILAGEATLDRVNPVMAEYQRGDR